MMVFNRELIFSTILLLMLPQVSLAQKNSLVDTTSSRLSKSLHLSISSMKNKTGHWITLFSVSSNATRLSNHWNADLNLNTRTNGAIESVHAVGAYVEAPHIDEHTRSSGNTVPARYTLYPGIGYYKMYNTVSLNFHQAFYNCSVDGGHLAIINSVEEANLFKEFWTKFPTSGSFVYLGFNDLLKPEEYKTIFGQTLQEAGYNKWAQGEPSGKSLCGFFDQSGLLRAMACSNTRPFLCEFPQSNNF